MNRIHAIAASSLCKSFSVRRGFMKKNQIIKVLDDISFTLMEGETLGILGESGSGKTTLANLLVGSESASSGMLLIDSKDVTELKAQQRLTGHRKVRMVFQDPHASLNPRLTIFKLLEEPLRNFTHLDKDERKELILKTLDLVGLKSEHGQRLPHMFSAGERQRIAIARALILDPVCIVLDEPLSSLDISVQSQILNLMLELQKTLGISYILITHNLPVLRHMCDQIMVLCNGQVVENGPTDSILNQALHPYTKYILSNAPKINYSDVIKDASFSGCIYSDRCPHAIDNCFSERPVQQLFDERIVYCHRINEIN